MIRAQGVDRNDDDGGMPLAPRAGGADEKDKENDAATHEQMVTRRYGDVRRTTSSPKYILSRSVRRDRCAMRGSGDDDEAARKLGRSSVSLTGGRDAGQY